MLFYYHQLNVHQNTRDAHSKTQCPLLGFGESAYA